MKKIASVLLLAVFALSACKESFKKGDDGIEYKIIADGKGEKVAYGDFMQMNMTQYYQTGKEDSLLMDTRLEQGAMINILDSVNTPIAFYKVLSQLKVGDSMVIRILTDSAFAKSPQGVPPIFKKGHYFLTAIRLTNVYKTREQADSARDAQAKEAAVRAEANAKVLLAKEDKIIADYLAKNKITAVKTPMGAYVQIIEPGTNPKVDTGMVANVNYTGRTLLENIMFDSNTDPAKGHVEPLPVNLTTDPSLGNNVIDGWKDGIKMLGAGGKAKFYIPSPLAYGTQGAGPDIKPNTILVFDIEVLDVMNKTQAAASASERNKKMQEEQKRFMDSLQKQNPQTVPAQ